MADLATSPLGLFVDALRGIAKANPLLAGAEQTLGPHWLLFRQDVEMMLREGVTMGLRDRWVRRVAVPVCHAYHGLQDLSVPRTKRATDALAVLQQCTDVNVRTECINWINANMMAEELQPSYKVTVGPSQTQFPEF